VTTQFGLAWTPVFGALMVAVSLVLLAGLIWLARPVAEETPEDCEN